jgi:cyclophilin family peptidyl-prolyl cis-trans isomerase
VPTEKRQRQKAGRQERLNQERKQAKQRQLLRRIGIIAVVAVVIVGSVYLLTRSSSTPPPPPTPQQAANALAVKAGCPSSPTTRTNTLHWTHQPAMSIEAKKTYVATFVTTAGTFTAVLNTATAPVNTNNFVFLADEGYYKCVTFHRVIPQFVDQGGDPTATGTGGPGYTVTPNEFPKAAADPKKQYALGAIAMANSCPQGDTPATCPDTNGGQFFIVAGPEGQALPPEYTNIGQVLTGMNVVEKINAEGNVNSPPPNVWNRILSITISNPATGGTTTTTTPS